MKLTIEITENPDGSVSVAPDESRSEDGSSREKRVAQSLLQAADLASLPPRPAGDSYLEMTRNRSELESLLKLRNTRLFGPDEG